MAPKSKDSRIRLGEPLATDFAALRIVLGIGNTEIGVIREAVREYIDRKTKNKAIGTRYETQRARLNATKARPLRLVTRDKENDA